MHVLKKTYNDLFKNASVQQLHKLSKFIHYWKLHWDLDFDIRFYLDRGVNLVCKHAYYIYSAVQR